VPSDTALPIEHEMLAEKASALARAGENLAAALAAVARVESELAAASTGDRPAFATRKREARDLAAERLWFLLVQREAIGLLHHEGMLREYGVPRDVRFLAGPRRRR